MSPVDRLSAMTLKVRVSASHDSRAAFSARELLCLAVGGCYVDDLFLEADKRGIAIRSVHVDVEANGAARPRAHAI